jgi:hypothetical protein
MAGGGGRSPKKISGKNKIFQVNFEIFILSGRFNQTPPWSESLGTALAGAPVYFAGAGKLILILKHLVLNGKIMLLFTNILLFICCFTIYYYVVYY